MCPEKKQELTVSTDKSLLDCDFIYGFLSESYWNRGRTAEEMQTCIDTSLNFGLYLEGKQIGYARVLTDYVQFAYLMDVFVADEHRGKGYSKFLMQQMMTHSSLQKVRMWRLATKDAHGLYEQFGFKALEKPENMMEKLNIP